MTHTPTSSPSSSFSSSCFSASSSSISMILYGVPIAIIIMFVAYWVFRRIARRRLENNPRPHNEATEMVSIRNRDPDAIEIMWYFKEVLTPKNRKDEICPICLDHFEVRVTQAPCGHVFHKDCIRQWLLNTKNCPICRSPLTLRVTV
jgi:uncharacterized protein YneF (UPF0154 family)